MFTPFYHELMRKYVAIFGSLFNNVQISRSDGSDANAQAFKVPIGYGPREKFLAITRQKPGDKIQQIQLPRMSFEITGVEYDSQRKFQRTQKYNNTEQALFEPAPYDIQFQLNIMTKSTLDAVKIVEQILPYFNPDWVLEVQLIDGVERTWDIPIIRTGISHEEAYDESFTERRMIVWTIDFTMRAWLHGPLRPKKRIKFITVNTRAGDTNDSIPMSQITIQPGLTANGEPTTDIDETIPYQSINMGDDWDYIVLMPEVDNG